MLMPMLGLNGVVPQCALSTQCTLFTGVAHCVYQSVMYRYREFPVTGIFHLFGVIGTGIGKKLYQKKVSDSVPEKFGAKKYRCGIGI